MILSDRDIEQRLEEGALAIEPLDDPELQIQPASVDLRLGTEFLEFRNHGITCIHPDRPSEVQDYTQRQARLRDYKPDSEKNFRREMDEGDAYVLHPGDFVLGTTYERVAIPDDLVARVEGRSSLGRLAIVVHATAGFIDPGYEGQITLELSNLGEAPVALRPKEMRVSQLVFTELSSPARRPYGAERGSKYQDQSGPTASRIQDDEEWRPGDGDASGQE